MRKYGKLLLTELPDDATQLLQKLCSEWIPKGHQPGPGMEWSLCGIEWRQYIM